MREMRSQPKPHSTHLSHARDSSFYQSGTLGWTLYGCVLCASSWALEWKLQMSIPATLSAPASRCIHAMLSLPPQQSSQSDTAPYLSQCDHLHTLSLFSESLCYSPDCSFPAYSNHSTWLAGRSTEHQTTSLLLSSCPLSLTLYHGFETVLYG
jgi:hypothetical protein